MFVLYFWNKCKIKKSIGGHPLTIIQGGGGDPQSVTQHDKGRGELTHCDVTCKI